MYRILKQLDFDFSVLRWRRMYKFQLALKSALSCRVGLHAQSLVPKKGILMKNTRWRLPALLLLALGTASPAQTPKPAERRTSGQVIDYFVTLEEARVTAVAEAMPADRYSFAPTSGEFKGVRTFAEQLKHLAAANYMLAAAILGDRPPAGVGDETGPGLLQTKADILPYLKDSFAYLHRAVATIDDQNMVIDSPPISPLPKGTATRLGLAVEALLHTFNHYGQMVEYLRMNRVVPPASRSDAGGSGGIKQ